MAKTTRGKETQYECPACLGVMMAKLSPSEDAAVILDYCRRCGGIWFDSGEVDELRRCSPKGLNASISLNKAAFQMRCHSCQATIDRNAEKCDACGSPNVISCPVDSRELRRIEREDVALDVCPDCKGVWFDNTELASVWNKAVSAASKGQPTQTRSQDSFRLDDLLYDPYVLGDLIVFGGRAVESAVRGVAGLGKTVLEGAPDAAGAIVQGTGHAAGAAAEGAVDVGAAFFDGLGGLVEGLDLSVFDLS